VRLAAEAEVLDEGNVVTHVVGDDDAALPGSRSQDDLIILTPKIRTVARDGNGVDPPSAKLLSDRGVIVLVEQQPQALAARRRAWT
jgi:hypothetical protein